MEVDRVADTSQVAEAAGLFLGPLDPRVTISALALATLGTIALTMLRGEPRQGARSPLWVRRHFALLSRFIPSSPSSPALGRLGPTASAPCPQLFGPAQFSARSPKCAELDASLARHVLDTLRPNALCSLAHVRPVSRELATLVLACRVRASSGSFAMWMRSEQILASALPMWAGAKRT